MGKRVMALLRENTDKSFFFAFGAGKTFSILCGYCDWKCSEYFRVFVSDPVERFLWGLPFEAERFFVCLNLLLKHSELM